ncbi:MAG: putative signal transducing protein [Mobilitalea sp.]
MPWCPDCKLKYRDNVTTCTKCGGDLLIDELKDNQNVDSIVQSEPCILASNVSQLDATMICALLEDAGIPFFIKDRGSGGYLKIYMGFTVYGQDIYVYRICYEDAKELLDFYNNTNIEPFELEQDMSIEDADISEQYEEDTKSPPLKRSTAARIIILVNVFVALAVYTIIQLVKTGWFNK